MSNPEGRLSSPCEQGQGLGAKGKQDDCFYAEPSPQALSLLGIVIHAYQHAEAVVQARLYNFLFADSILLLSWATVYAGTTRSYKRTVLLTLAFLSTLLGVCWFVLGTRHRKFLFVHSRIIGDVQDRLPQAWQAHRHIAELQNGEPVAAAGQQYKLTRLEKAASSRNLGVAAPLLMALASALLLYVSFRVDQ